MDMDFTKVSFDADLEEIEDAEELRGIVRDFEDAQDSNISEFENATETLDEFEGRVAESQEFKEDLAEDLSEVSPLSEDEALTYDMARINELIDEFSEEKSVDEGDDGGEGGEGGKFSNMGTQGKTHIDDDEKEFAEKHLGDIGGLNF